MTPHQIYEYVAKAYEAALGGPIEPLYRDKAHWMFLSWLVKRKYGVRVGRDVILDEEQRGKLSEVVENFEQGIADYQHGYLPVWVGMWKLGKLGLSPADTVIERGIKAGMKPPRKEWTGW